jgi:hypothetical protein
VICLAFTFINTDNFCGSKEEEVTGRWYNVLVVKHEGRRQVRRPRCRWKDNIKTDLREIGWMDVNWTDLAQDSKWWWVHVSTVMTVHWNLTR